jgi:hypothetical protein
MLLCLTACTIERAPSEQFACEPNAVCDAGLVADRELTDVASFDASFTADAPGASADSDPIAPDASPENTKPTARAITASCFRDQRCYVLLEASDAEGDPLTYQVVNPPDEGTISADPRLARRFIYVPRAGFVGSDRFTYRADDGQERSMQAEASITIAAPPAGWWDARFSLRRHIDLRNPETVRRHPVLIALSSGTLDPERVEPDGADLAFVDPMTSTPIAHEIVEWNLSGDTLIWVKVPLMPGAIDLYYSSPEGRSASDPEELWSSYEGVWHLESAVDDASGTRSEGAAVDVTFEPGISLLGASFRAASAIVVPPGGFTARVGSASLWVRTDPGAVFEEPAMLLYGSSFSRASGFGPEDELHLHLAPNGELGFFMNASTSTSVSIRGTGRVNDGSWHHVAATWQLGDFVILYLDGAEIGRAVHPGSTFTSTSAVRIARAPSGAGGFSGWIDEVRLSPDARTDQWIAAEHRVLTSTTVVIVGPEDDGT